MKGFMEQLLEHGFGAENAVKAHGSDSEDSI